MFLKTPTNRALRAKETQPINICFPAGLVIFSPKEQMKDYTEGE